MGEVVRGKFITTLKTSPDRAREGAADYGLESVVIIGLDKDGEFFFASSEPGTADTLWFLEKARHRLMTMEDEIEASGDPRGKPGRGS